MQRHVAGGRDFDRILFNDFVVPWLKENYSLPDDWLSLDEYKKLCSVATYLAENSKIELSSSDAVTIQGDDNVHFEDEDGGRFKSGGTLDVHRNVFANSALSSRRNSTTKT